MKNLYTTLFFFSFIIASVFAQNSRSQIKTAQTLISNQKYEEAINVLTDALKSNSDNVEVLQLRGYCFEHTNNLNSALSDYKKALAIEPQNTETLEKLANTNVMLGNYAEAINQYTSIINQKKKLFIAYKQMAYAKIKLKDFKTANADIDEALKLDSKDFTANFYKGIALDSLGNYGLALKSYAKAISSLEKDKLYTESANKSEFKFFYINPARSSSQLMQFDQALNFLKKANELAPNDFDVAYYSAEAKAKNKDYSGALAHYNKALSINNNHYNSYINRGYLYLEMGDVTNANSDFSRAIVIDPKSAEGFFGKGIVQEKNGDLKAALISFNKAKELNQNSRYLTQYDKTAAAYKLTAKEENKPEIILEYPKLLNPKTVYVLENDMSTTIKGRIKDESKISKLLINDISVPFNASNNNPEFSFEMNLSTVKSLLLSATDEFGNNTTSSYSIEKVEAEKPVCNLLLPNVESGFINLKTTNNYLLYIEGNVSDKSLIQSVLVNGKTASFDQTKLNPTFTATIETANIESITIKITDRFGNESNTTHPVMRDSAIASEANPMGKTWVVFIENSNYTNLSSLEAVANDVAMVKNALSGYIIDSIISRKNLSKTAMERFFSIELRNLVATNKVNSLLIWYSGHGKTTGENGYWLPVDASKKDEFTYFSTTNLKGYLGTYKGLKHTLVVADATETGPSFYLAMRDTQTPRDCGDYEVLKLKSAQVLSAADVEKKNESSILCKTFSQTLKSTKDRCISIDNISAKINVAAKENQKQKPKFGNIKDLNDENGTFYFMRK